MNVRSRTGRCERPILVTGLHRSGTTWVGTALAQSGQVSYLHEPFTYSIRPRLLSLHLQSNYTYVSSENADRYRTAVADLLGYRFPIRSQIADVRSSRDAARLTRDFSRSLRRRMQGRRPLLKDPMALFSAEWLADAFDAQVVVMVRHPAAFASSLKRLDWNFPFEAWLGQPLLMRDHLEVFREEIEHFAAERRDIVDQAILLWRAGNAFVTSLAARRRDWAFLRCEDLADHPLDGFRSLYSHLGLSYSPGVADRVLGYSMQGNVKEVAPGDRGGVRRDSSNAKWTWTDRLTPEEITRVYEGTADVAATLYPDHEWQRPSPAGVPRAQPSHTTE